MSHPDERIERVGSVPLLGLESFGLEPRFRHLYFDERDEAPLLGFATSGWRLSVSSHGLFARTRRPTSIQVRTTIKGLTFYAHHIVMLLAAPFASDLGVVSLLLSHDVQEVKNLVERNCRSRVTTLNGFKMDVRRSNLFRATPIDSRASEVSYVANDEVNSLLPLPTSPIFEGFLPPTSYGGGSTTSREDESLPFVEVVPERRLPTPDPLASLSFTPGIGRDAEGNIIETPLDAPPPAPAPASTPSIENEKNEFPVTEALRAHLPPNTKDDNHGVC